MSRVWSCGFELGSGTIEFSSVSETGSCVVQSGFKRSGNFAGKVFQPQSGVGCGWGQVTSASTQPSFHRVYLYIEESTDESTCIFRCSNEAPAIPHGSPFCFLQLSGDNTLLVKRNNSGILGTGALAFREWNIIELRTLPVQLEEDISSLDVRLNGSEIVSVNNLPFTSNSSFALGVNLQSEHSSSGIWYFDDIAVNNNAGTNQNSYPGEGSIVHLRPNASGDYSDGSSGPTADQAGYSVVDEATPNDAEDYWILADPSTSTTDPDILDVNCENFSLSNTGITLVQVGYRGRGESATSCSVNLRIKSQSSGIVVEGITATIVSTGWVTHDDTASFQQYKLTSYVEPQNSGVWTTDLLNSMQIGIRAPDATPDVWVTALWALVEYQSGVFQSPSVFTNFVTCIEQLSGINPSYTINNEYLCESPKFNNSNIEYKLPIYRTDESSIENAISVDAFHINGIDHHLDVVGTYISDLENLLKMLKEDNFNIQNNSDLATSLELDVEYLISSLNSYTEVIESLIDTTTLYVSTIEQLSGTIREIIVDISHKSEQLINNHLNVEFFALFGPESFTNVVESVRKIDQQFQLCSEELLSQVIGLEANIQYLLNITDDKIVNSEFTSQIEPEMFVTSEENLTDTSRSFLKPIYNLGGSRQSGEIYLDNLSAISVEDYIPRILSVGVVATGNNVIALQTNAPNGVEANNVLFLTCASSETGTSPVTPSGWDLIGNVTYNDINSTNFWRIADGSSTDTPFVTFAGSGDCVAFMLRCDPVKLRGWVTAGGESSGVFTTLEGDVTPNHILFQTVVVDDASIVTDPSGWTREAIFNATGDFTTTLAVYSKIPISGGVYGGEVGTLSTSDDSITSLVRFESNQAKPLAVTYNLERAVIFKNFILNIENLRDVVKTNNLSNVNLSFIIGEFEHVIQHLTQVKQDYIHDISNTRKLTSNYSLVVQNLLDIYKLSILNNISLLKVANNLDIDSDYSLRLTKTIDQSLSSLLDISKLFISSVVYGEATLFPISRDFILDLDFIAKITKGNILSVDFLIELLRSFNVDIELLGKLSIENNFSSTSLLNIENDYEITIENLLKLHQDSTGSVAFMSKVDNVFIVNFDTLSRFVNSHDISIEQVRAESLVSILSIINQLGVHSSHKMDVDFDGVVAVITSPKEIWVLSPSDTSWRLKSDELRDI